LRAIDGRGSYNRAWVGPDKYDFTIPEQEITRYLSIKPDLRLIVEIGVDAPPWWAEKNPDERFRFYEGSAPEQLSTPASLKLRQESGEALAKTLEHWERSRFAKNIVAYRIHSMLDNGEYHLLGGWDLKHADYSPAMQNYFRNFLKEKYAANENLRKAWGKPDANFENASIPSGPARATSELFVFRDFNKSRDVADYEECLNAVVADWAIHFSKIAKRAAPISHSIAKRPELACLESSRDAGLPEERLRSQPHS